MNLDTPLFWKCAQLFTLFGPAALMMMFGLLAEEWEARGIRDAKTKSEKSVRRIDSRAR